MSTWRRRPALGPSLILVPILLAVGVAACGGDDDDAGAAVAPEVSAGRQIATRAGCAACHGADGQGGIGPPWVGLYGSTVDLADGSTATADETYLSTAIKDPDADVAAGYSISMPTNDLSDDDVAALIAYIRSLGPSTGTTDTTESAG